MNNIKPIQPNYKNRQFTEAMGFFDLNEKESIILNAILLNHELSTIQIKKLLSTKSPHIYNILNNLCEQGWIELVSNSPKTYKITDKNKFREILNSLIKKTSDTLENQKQIFHSLLEIFENKSQMISSNNDNSIIQNATSATHSVAQNNIIDSIKIPPELPPELNSWALSSFKIIENDWIFSILKSETNMTIKLKKGTIIFKLSSIELVIEEKKASYKGKGESIPIYGGCLLCHFSNPGDSDELLAEVHKYNRDVIMMSLKMESKGFMDNRKSRGIEKYEVINDALDSDDGLISKLTISLKNKNLTGMIKSFLDSDNHNRCFTIWAEDIKIFNEFMKYF